MSTTAIKLVALALMLVDHIGEYFPAMPVWLRLLGRLSAPLFLFCAMWGYHYTHDRAAYRRRLYLCGAGMALGNMLLNSLFPAAPAAITNNFFVTLLLCCMVVEIIEQFRLDRRAGWKSLGLFVLLQAVSTPLCLLSERFSPAYPQLMIGALLPNVLFNEGGPLWVLLGVLLYLTKETKKQLAIGYGSFCATYFVLTLANGRSLIGLYGAHGAPFSLMEYLFQMDFQWLMALSLPFMLAYNGKPGRGLKKLFYIFYPAHIYALFLLSALPAG